MRRWLEANPDDEIAQDVRAKLTSEPERYAATTREYLGWGVFALMPAVMCEWTPTCYSFPSYSTKVGPPESPAQIQYQRGAASNI